MIFWLDGQRILMIFYRVKAMMSTCTLLITGPFIIVGPQLYQTIDGLES